VISQWPRWLRIGAPLALVVFVGTVDYLTGYEILFSIFYLIAIALAVWTMGRGFAVLVSLLSLASWLGGDLLSGAVYPRPFVPVWNAAIVLASYLVVVALIGRLREAQRQLEERVRQRTVALTEEMAERERLEREILEIGERERRRIGRDLHDSLGQLLTGTALAGQVLEETLDGRAAPEAVDAARIVTLVEQAIEMTRALSRGLDPVELEGGGLDQALRELAAATSRSAPVHCEYQGDGAATVPDNAIATHLYRITQEAITNALKHGHAARITIRLERVPGRVRLTVRDDGIGIAEPSRRGHGMGLRIMAHRATVLGGTLAVRAVRSGGSVVECEVPQP
jgi:signal transduction histidine kinase